MEPNGNLELRLRDTTQVGNRTKLPRNSTIAVKVGAKNDANVKETQERGKFSKIKAKCVTCCTPYLSSRNPMPDNPNTLQKFRHALMLPPHGTLAFYLQFVIVCVQIWIVMYAITHGDALPGGNLYSLLILFIACAVGGYCIAFIHLPPLLGMLIVGVMLRNIPGIKTIGQSIDIKWSGALRKLALTVILTRAGLGLDPIKLKKLSWAVLRLAFTPCICEAITVGIVSHFLLGFPWKWSLMLGCILGALSPAVTVPSLVSLQDRKYGVAKGIPTMLLAAGGLDNVMCVTGFSVFLGIIFSEGDLAVTIIKGPVGVLVGIVYGFVMGILLWYLPAKDSTNSVFYRSMLLFGCGMVAIFGSSAVGLSGAGPLGCLTTATVAAYKWRQRRKPGETDEIAGVMALAWLIMQHFLFGLIGAAVNIDNIQGNTAGLGIATLAIGLCVRSAVSFSVTLGTGFNLKERLFITFTWIAKATVQAAIGGLALDRAKEEENPSEEDVRLGTDVLTISVLAIIICAPVGATLMAVLGPRFLVKGDEDDEETEVTGKQEPIEDLKVTENQSKELPEKLAEPVLNYVKYVSEDSNKCQEKDIQISDKICSECAEKEADDTRRTAEVTNKPNINAEAIEEISYKNEPENSSVAVQANSAYAEPPVTTENDINKPQGSTKDHITSDSNINGFERDTDASVDKSTGTDKEQNETRRPFYVSSIIVELNDSNNINN